MKIERLLGLSPAGPPRRLLEIGTGSGGIADYFVRQSPAAYDVSACDVVDQRVARSGFRFATVKGVSLPYADQSFDVVISNHVIEHVGDRTAQLAHLREIRRVLAAGGVGYLAVPNRWMLVEPHFGLPLLSWLPRPLASAYVRLAGRGLHYDCRPLTAGQLTSMVAEAQMTAVALEVPAIRIHGELEGRRGLVLRAVERLPSTLLRGARPIVPTLICLLRRVDQV